MRTYELPKIVLPQTKEVDEALEQIVTALTNSGRENPEEEAEIFAGELWVKVLGTELDKVEASETEDDEDAGDDAEPLDEEAQEAARRKAWADKWAERIHDKLDESASFRKLQELVEGTQTSGRGPFATLLKSLTIIIEEQSSEDNAPEEDSEDQEEGDGDPSSNGQGDGPGQDLAEAIEQAAQGASEEAQQEAIAKTFGKDPGKLTPLPPSAQEQIRQAMANIPNAYRQAVNKIGRMLDNYSSPSMEDQENAVDTVTDLCRGGDISRMHLTEAIKLTNPTLKKLWLQSYVEKSLVQYQIEGKAPRRDRGAMAILLDESGSMQGRNTIEARAFIAVALYHAASKGRPATVFGFDTAIRWQAKLERRGANLAETIAAVFSYGPSGGTSFDGPLRTALSVVQAEEDTDILIVTDGEGDLSEGTKKALEAQKKKGLRIFGFALDGAEKSQYLKGVVDEWLQLSESSTTSTVFRS